MGQCSNRCEYKRGEEDHEGLCPTPQVKGERQWSGKYALVLQKRSRVTEEAKVGQRLTQLRREGEDMGTDR